MVNHICPMCGNVIKCGIATYTDFSQKNRQSCLSKHRSIQTAQRFFKKTAKIYNGIHGHRVWTVADGKTIEDTNENTSDNS